MNGFWYDVFHPDWELTSLVMWRIVYFGSAYIGVGFIFGAIVAFVYGFWPLGILGIALTALMFRVCAVSLDRAT